MRFRAEQFMSRLALLICLTLSWPLTTIAQETLPDYTASAGMLSVGADPERPDIEMFHVDYTVDGAILRRSR